MPFFGSYLFQVISQFPATTSGNTFSISVSQRRTSGRLLGTTATRSSPEDFIDDLDLGGRDYLVPAPGPRGGQGWRLSDDAVQELQRLEEKEDRRRQSIEALVDATSVKYGELRYHQGPQRIVWRLALPYLFKHYRGCLERDGCNLSYAVNTRNRSVKKIAVELVRLAVTLADEVERAIHAEQIALLERQSQFDDWLQGIKTDPALEQC